MAFKISHFHLKISDPLKTAKWWVEHLGAKTVPVRSGAAGAWVDLDGIIFRLSRFNERPTSLQRYGLEHLAVTVDDYEKVMKKLAANGARIVEEQTNATTGRRTGHIETPEGVMVEVMEAPK